MLSGLCSEEPLQRLLVVAVFSFVLFWLAVICRIFNTLWKIHSGGIPVLRPGWNTLKSLFESKPEKLFASLARDLQRGNGIVAWLTPVGKPFLVVNDESVLSQIIVENQPKLTKHHAFGVLEYFRRTDLTCGDAWRVVHKLSSRFPISKRPVTQVMQPKLQKFCSEALSCVDFAEYTKEFYWGLVLVLVTGIEEDTSGSLPLRNLYKIAWTASIEALGQPLSHMISFYMYLPLPSVIKYRYYSSLLRSSLLDIIKSGKAPSWSVIGVASDMHLSVEDQLEVAMEFMFTGASSVTTVLTWFIYHIAQNPSLQSNIRKEIVESMKSLDNVVDSSDSSLLKSWATIDMTSRSENIHLDAGLRETLRLYSPIHIGRLVLEDFSVKDTKGTDIHIYKGTDIMSNMWFIHRSEKNWGKNFNQYDHSRFLSVPHNVSNYHPFSMGVRSCPGKKIADAVIKQIASNLVLKYDIGVKGDYSKSASFEPNLMLPVTPQEVYLTFKSRNV